MYTMFQLFHSSFLTDFLFSVFIFMFPIFLLKTSLRSSILLLSLLSILITSVLNPASGKLSPFCLVLSLEFYCVLLFETSFVSSFWLPPYVCFCVLGRAAMSPGCIKWLYIVRVLWGPVAKSPWSLSQVLQVCPMYRLWVPFCYSWALISVGRSVGGGIYSQENWLQVLAMSTVMVLLCRSWHHGAGVSLLGSSAGFLCHLWKWLGDTLVWSEVGHQVSWFWALLGGVLIQANVSHCLCHAWWHLVWATKWCADGLHLYWAWRCLGKSKLLIKAGYL